MVQDFREKYRPKSFSTFVGDKRTIKILTNIVKSAHLPKGMLIYGPAGSGKTSLAQVFMKALYCQSFSEDVCGECEECLSFEKLFSRISQWPYVFDCTRISEKVLEEIFQNTFWPPQRMGRQIYIFDEFHRAKVPLQEKLLKPLETQEDRLVIFCLIDLKTVGEAFRQRVTVLKTNRPEFDELIFWLQRICDSEGIIIKDGNALRQIALSADRLPRECLGLLEKVYLLGEPLSTSLAKELAQDNRGDHSDKPQYRIFGE